MRIPDLPGTWTGLFLRKEEVGGGGGVVGDGGLNVIRGPRLLYDVHLRGGGH